MSRQNKVNPGMYTQRGRLTQDDAARELTRQRAIGSHHTWQPVQRDQMPNLRAEPDDADTEQDTGKSATAAEEAPIRAKAATPRAARSAKPAKPRAKAVSRKPVKTAARKTVSKKATAMKRGKTKTAKAVRPKAKAAKRRKS